MQLLYPYAYAVQSFPSNPEDCTVSLTSHGWWA